MNWILRSFNQLTNDELYALLLLRSKVFVVEQNCIFLDMDNKDQKSYHLLGYDNDILVAYTRLVPAGVSYEEMSIGRVVTDPGFRAKGMGKELMQQSIEAIYRLYGKQPVRIGAQLYLKYFYESFGFVQASDTYIEDGIPHIEMLLA
ncbi:GNAT family N-acetyltransferase [Chitinophagaceae bacterium MMS25-I14]